MIADLNRELKGSEDEYVKTLKKQYDDLEILAQRMEEQYKTMDGAYRQEIKQIVTALGNIIIRIFKIIFNNHADGWSLRRP